MEALWKITLFGALRAEQGGQAITRFRTRKTAALLAYLAFHPTRPLSRDELVEQFWPDDEPDATHPTGPAGANEARAARPAPGAGATVPHP